jgi:hypothetical protein
MRFYRFMTKNLYFLPAKDLFGDTLQSQDIPSSPETPVLLPDLSLLFPLSVPDPAPLPFRPATIPERKRGGSFSRYSGCFARFFEQVPGRKVQAALRPVPELKWSAARKIALARDLHRCRRCDTREPGLLTVHHVFPRGLGGGNEPGNLVTLCESCHQALCRQCSRPAPARVSMGETAAAVRESLLVPAGPD